MNLSLLNKNALIAGASQGIGLAIAKELASLGANCTLVARNTTSLTEAVSQLSTTNNQQHDFLALDFSDFKNVGSSINEYVKDKTFNILINNSGGPAGGAITEAKAENFLSAFQQHLICNQIISQAVIPSMKASNYGRIVNIISTSVKIPLKGLGVSNTIRGAVASWAKTMANELGQYGITVNNILPGATLTARLESIIKNKSTKTKLSEEEISNEMLNEIPMKRFALPEEIANVAAFLCTPAAAYVNGTSIPVDGGRTGSI